MVIIMLLRFCDGEKGYLFVGLPLLRSVRFREPLHRERCYEAFSTRHSVRVLVEIGVQSIILAEKKFGCLRELGWLPRTSRFLGNHNPFFFFDKCARYTCMMGSSAILVQIASNLHLKIIVYHRHSLHGLRTSYLLSEYENDLGLLTVVPLCGEESAEWGRSGEVSGEVSNAKIGEGKWGTAKDTY